MTNWGAKSAYDMDCTLCGCARIYLEPKLHFFDECFQAVPGIRMADIDGAVERNGQILLLEWKRPGAQLKTGQKRFHEAFTANSTRQKSIIVWGDPQNMRCEKVLLIENGRYVNEGDNCDIEELKRRIEAWFNRANTMKQAAA